MIKFFFLIHNTNVRVKDYLIEHMKPEKTLADEIQLAKTVESTAQLETLSKQLLQNVGKLKLKYLVSISSRTWPQEVQIQMS